MNRGTEARVDLQGNEASEVEWGCRGNRETEDLKDNL